ncbi:glycosyltransferase [Rhodococcus sp. B50]|uniref:glycosyltransferase n=1 Tax=Rhodococcus sp. B50 TaxID=2682847 RepID=UPI001BD38B42|nr:glycosyltransferase [Rhodococcus sp. B50]MBS9375452.1 GalNAc-alpha-(1->4)-GalNAc-alpha-(1->3)-diNAcBac-PP-undecaprenol alpha-1,4-N-acetyl-D-galactosaminyltransferase [Rhodococcus sp. B50]
MRVAILVPSLGGGGAEFVAREWARWLNTTGVDARLVVCGPVDPLLRPDGVQVHSIPDKGFIRRLLAVRRYAASSRVDIILGLMPYFNLLALISQFGRVGGRARVVISGRNVEVPLRKIFGIKFRAIQAIAKICYPFADAYIAISHTVAAEAAALYRIEPKNIYVVPNPATAKVDVRAAHATIKCSRDTLAPQHSLNLVVPARLVEQKRPHIPVLVASEITKHFEHVEVHFFGIGPLESEIQQLAQGCSVSVKFHGWVEAWFEECPPNSVVLLASLAEGFGNVLVEAASVGIPSVVSSRCLGSSDAIVPGLTGELCAGDSVNDYAEAVLAVADLTMNGAESAWLSRFTLESSGNRVLRVLRDVYKKGVRSEIVPLAVELADRSE